MSVFVINLNKVEEWQMVKNLSELELLFRKAKISLVQGNSVLIKRKNPDGSSYIAQEITSEDDLKNYQKIVFKYL